MKRYLFVDDEGKDLQDAAALLTAHGYKVSEAGNEIDRGLAKPSESNRPGAFGQPIPESTRLDICASDEAILVARADDGLVLEMSSSFLELTGYEREELLGQPMLGLAFFLDPGAWRNALASLAAGQMRVELETRILRKDGLVSFVKVFIFNTDIDGIPALLLTFRNKGPNALVGALGDTSGYSIADPESLNRDLSRQENGSMIDYHALQDLMNSFHKTTKLPMTITDINGNVQVATGWQEICTRFHRLHPESLKNCMESDIFLARNINEGEYAIYKCKNGMWDIATPIIVGGRHIANIFMGQFLFDDEVPDYELFRKQAQTYGFDEKEYLAALDRVPRWSRKTVESCMEFLSKLAMLISRLSIGNILLSQALGKQKGISEELQQASLVVENSPVVLFRWRAAPGWPVELVSQNVTQFGYTPDELISGATPFSSMIHPDDLERVTAEVKDYSSKGRDNFQQEYRIVSKSGETHWVYDRTVVERDEKGEISHFQGIAIDITDRKRAEQALRESEGKSRENEERLHLAMAAASQGFYDLDLLSGNAKISPEYATMLGYSVEEYNSSLDFWKEQIHPDDSERTLGVLHSVIEGELSSYSVEYRIRCRSGEWKWLLSQGQVTDYTADGAPARLMGLHMDIDVRKRAEEELLKSTERLQSIFRVAPVGIGVMKDRTILEVNRRFCEMTGYGQEEVLGMNSSMLYPSVEEYERVGGDKYRQIKDKGSGILETRWRKKDAAIIDVLLASTPLDPSNLAKGVIFTALDITDRKRSVERMRSTLAEKVVLLQEVHHRVKNNLQIITSLLDLQSDYINEEGARRFIRESQNRIRSMALVHEQLYRSGDLSSIDFAKYVDDLVSSLFVASVVDQERIGFQVDVLDVELDMDRAIPCGLVINELVSNAIKYAFPEGRRGTVRVACSRDSDGFISLKVSDNGVGMPKGLDFRRTETMGLQIVNLLTRQLQGKIETLDVDGTAFIIAFPGEACGRRGDRSAVAGKS